MRDVRRQLDSAQTFTASSPVSFDLPRDNVYKEIELFMAFNIVTAAGGAVTTPFEHSPWTLIKRVELVADGKDTIKSYDGATLHDINWHDFGIYTPTEDFEIGASADTGNNRFGLIMSLESVGMEFPQHTWLDARRLSSLELRITWGAAADVATTMTNTTITASITPWGHEILDVDPKSQFSINQEVMTQFAFPTNSATQRRFRLNVANAYRRILINTKDSNARATVDRMQMIRLVENGIFYRRIWDAGLIKIHNALKHGATGIKMEASAATDASEHPLFPEIAEAAGNPTQGVAGGYRSGQYMIDIAEDGSENSLLDTRGYSDLSLELDWNGANTTDLMRITPSIYIPSFR